MSYPKLNDKVINSNSPTDTERREREPGRVGGECWNSLLVELEKATMAVWLGLSWLFSTISGLRNPVPEVPAASEFKVYCLRLLQFPSECISSNECLVCLPLPCSLCGYWSTSRHVWVYSLGIAFEHLSISRPPTASWMRKADTGERENWVWLFQSQGLYKTHWTAIIIQNAQSGMLLNMFPKHCSSLKLY